MLGSNLGQLQLRHWLLSDALTTRLDLIHNRISDSEKLSDSRLCLILLPIASLWTCLVQPPLRGCCWPSPACRSARGGCRSGGCRSRSSTGPPTLRAFTQVSLQKLFSAAVLRIRIRMILGLLDPDPDL